MQALTYPDFSAPRAARIGTGNSVRRSLIAALLRLIACIGIAMGVTACGGGSSAAPATSVTALVGPAGGTVTGPDGVQVIIPAGALNQATTIGIARNSAGAPTSFPEDVQPAGGIYEFTPHDLIFNAPVTIRMPIPQGADGSEVFMASLGADWQVSAATVVPGFAEWARNSFSFGFVPVCTYNAGELYPCVVPRGYATATAAPSSAITRTGWGNLGQDQGSAGSWVVNQTGTVTLTLHYEAAPDCINAGADGARVKLLRWNGAIPAGTPSSVTTTLFDGPVALSLTNFPLSNGGTYQRLTGSTSVDVSAHLINATNAFGFTFSCQRPGKVRRTGGDLVTIIGPMVPTLTLGGAVSGLTAAGLVLQYNGGPNMDVVASGPFTFPTPIAADTAYNVAVLNQPAGQTCSVANGSGTASAAVNNIVVTCAATGSTYQIAAYVVGTATGPVVLQNNGTDTVTVNPNSNVYFATQIAAGSPYNITVLTPPVGQVCTVDPSSGIAPPPVGFEALVNCVTISPPSPAAVTDPSGNTVVGEGQSTNFTVTVYGSPTPTVQWQRSTDYGTTWSDIPGATGTTYTLANASVSDQGIYIRAVATNSGGTANSTGLQINVCIAGGPVSVSGAPSSVQGSFCPNIVQPGVIRVSAGARTVAWQEDYGGSSSESLLLEFDLVSNAVLGVSYQITNPTMLISQLCSVQPYSPPLCSGVTLDATTGVVHFSNTVLSTSTPITLNGTLTFTPF